MDAGVIVAWLRRIVEFETVPAGVVAFNVGLFETSDGFTAYLTGAKHYDPADDDWATEEAFTPRERYCPLGGAGLGWEAIRERVAAELRTFLDGGEAGSSFLATAEAVTVGFDDGDLLRVA